MNYVYLSNQLLIDMWLQLQREIPGVSLLALDEMPAHIAWKELEKYRKQDSTGCFGQNEDYYVSGAGQLSSLSCLFSVQDRLRPQEGARASFFEPSLLL